MAVPATKMLLQQSRSLIKQGKLEEARQYLRKHHEAGSHDIEIQHELIQLDILEKQFAQALEKVMQVLKHDCRHPLTYELAEQAAIELGEYELAKNFILFQPENISTDHQPKTLLTYPDAFKLPSIAGKGNDYRHILEKASLFQASGKAYVKTVSVIIPVYNRYQLLANTLAALTHQTYPHELMEIIVVDDGSSDEILSIIKKYGKKLRLSYIRQHDRGYRLSAARNLGVRVATGECIVIMDADILPLPNDIESYMRVLHVTDNAVLFGHRKYVDVSGISDDDILADIRVVADLPSIRPDNDVAIILPATGEVTDWRLHNYPKFNYLLSDRWPFRNLVGATFALPRNLLNKAGEFDEEFTAWGCEDGEFGYRLYNQGAYFIPMLDINSLHQEPLQAIDKNQDGDSYRKTGYAITRQIRARKCAAPLYRKDLGENKADIPKVSICIPAYNAGHYIVAAVRSCLEQDFDDMEICICDDGSTDNTVALLENYFADNPKVRWISTPHAGIANATNHAIGMSHGLYIGQLDADDLLKPDAIAACVAILDAKLVDAIHTDYDYIDRDGVIVRNGNKLDKVDRESLWAGHNVPSFRMFKRRAWARTKGCAPDLSHAADLDLWMQLADVSDIYYLPKVLYSCRWHGGNDSIVYRQQREQEFRQAVTASLQRNGLEQSWQIRSTHNPLNPQAAALVSIAENRTFVPRDILLLLPETKLPGQPLSAEWRNKLAAISTMGFRYLFINRDSNLYFTHVEQDTLYIPCTENPQSTSTLLKACEFAYRHLDFTHIYRPENLAFLDPAVLMNQLLPHLDGSQFISDSHGYFIKRSLIPLLLASADQDKRLVNKPEENYAHERQEWLATINQYQLTSCWISRHQ